MISIVRAKESDYKSIVNIGKISVAESHKNSCSAEVMTEFIDRNYNNEAIKKELKDINNIYYIINYNNKTVGFSKIILNDNHANIITDNITKLDRIYLLKEFYGLKLGYELLKFNIGLSRKNKQSGMWLYTWTKNERAIDFYIRAGFTITGNYDFHVAKNHYDPCYQMFLNFLESDTI